MKFVKADWDDVNMSSLQGSITISYDRLVQQFGEPEEGCEKTDVEWLLKFEDGTVATIYNWKDGPNYCGPDGTPVERIRDWHIGGHKSRALLLVKETLGL